MKYTCCYHNEKHTCIETEDMQGSLELYKMNLGILPIIKLSKHHGLLGIHKSGYS